MKKLLVKLIFDTYVKFGMLLKGIIPVSIRGKVKDRLTRQIRNDLTGREALGGRPDANQKTPGVNLVGYIRAEIGLGHSCRLIAQAVDVTQIPWCVVNYEKLAGVRYGDETWQHKIVEYPLYGTNIIHINPESISLASMYLPHELWEKTYTIGYYLWELTDIPDDWCKGFAFFQEIWAPSKFIIETLKKKVDKPLLWVPYGISVENYTSYGRGHFNLPDNRFLFLCMYDVNSTAQRKNPMGAIQAFKKAFAATDQKVGLVVKINNAKNQGQHEIRQMENELRAYNNVFFIKETLTRDEVNSLIYCTDAFVSLHRSEGFGLVIAESMYLNKPVIATNWSSNTDFMNEDNSCPVDYELVTINKDYGPYRKGYVWAEPDTGHAAHYMQRLVVDKAYYTRIAENGCRYIHEHYNFEKSAGIIKKRLSELGIC